MPKVKITLCLPDKKNVKNQKAIKSKFELH